MSDSMSDVAAGRVRRSVSAGLPYDERSSADLDVAWTCLSRANSESSIFRAAGRRRNHSTRNTTRRPARRRRW